MSQIVARIGFSMRELPVLVPYIPTENPRLRDTAYEVALVALTTNPSSHKDLLSTVKSWPPVIYSALPIISAIEPHLNTSSMTDALGEVGMNIVILILITNFGYYYIFSIMNYFTMSGTSRVVCN
ncbi:unnamed protein product [Camellia sinensis]